MLPVEIGPPASRLKPGHNKKRGKRFAYRVLELLTTKLRLDALRGAALGRPGVGRRRQIGARRNWNAHIPSENLDITKKPQ